MIETLQYEIPKLEAPLAHRNASYHGITEADRQRQLDRSPDCQGSGLTFAEETTEKLKVLKEQYLRNEVESYLAKQKDFEGEERCGTRRIIHGGFKEFEAKEIMLQPVSPLKLLVADAGRHAHPAWEKIW